MTESGERKGEVHDQVHIDARKPKQDEVGIVSGIGDRSE